PPPLVTRRCDAHGRRDARAVDLGHRAESQDEDRGEDESRRRGPRDLETSVALERRGLSGQVAGGAVAPDRVDERGLDPDEDERRDDPDDESERPDRVSRRPHGRRVVRDWADARRAPALGPYP